MKNKKGHRFDETMNRFEAKTRLFVFWVVVLLLLQISSASGHDPYNDPEKPSVVKAMLDTISIWKKSHEDSWGKIKAIVHQIQLNFFPPNLEGRVSGSGESKIKEAVGKSVEGSKETVENSAKSAAKMAGEAMHVAAGKVKETTINADDDDKAEL